MENKEQEKFITLGEQRGLWLAQNKTVRFKPWKGLQEAEMAEMLKKNGAKLEGGKVCKKVSLMLSYMCVEIAGAVFWEQDDKGKFVERMTQSEREAHISKMYEADVLAAFMLMRMACIDEILSMSLPSPYAKGRMCPWAGDLSQLAFEGSQDPEECLWTYELSSPALVRGKMVNSFHFRPPLWSTAEKLELEDPENTNLSTIAGAICGSPELDGIPGHKIEHFYERDLYDVTKKDLSRMAKQMEDHHSGLNLAIEVFDSKEGREGRTFTTSIPWIYPDFFEDSSQ